MYTLLALAVARHDFHLVHFGELLRFAEFHIVQHQRPHIVAESVCVQFGGFECDTRLDFCVQCRVYRLVELQQHLESQLGRNLSVLP